MPDATYLILNVANSTKLTDEDTELVRNTNMVLDTSGRTLTNLGESIEKVGADKFAFGSHSPILDYLTGLLRIESLREAEATEETKELLRSGNARMFLKL